MHPRTRRVLFAATAFLTAAFAAAAWSGSRADDKTDAKVPPARTPWTTSKVVGSPEPPPPYKSVQVFPNVKLHQPTLIVSCPGSDRLFVGERPGGLYSVANTPDAKPELFFDFKTQLKTVDRTPGAKGVDSLYSLVFHPQFAQNRLCYVCYTLDAKAPKTHNLPNGSRISRFTVTKTEPPRLDPDSEEIVLTWEQGGHNGCDLHFGPDGMLYLSTGDARSPNPPDPLNTGQDCSDLLSSVLRVDVDQKDAGKNYAVPKDNPFVGVDGVRPEIWAYGFRNPWRMSFDRKTGELWLGDVGWELWEMVHRIEKGGNYGWSITEARQPIKPTQKPGPTPIRPPVIEIPHTLGASVTGGYVYRGKKLPELDGAYIFGDWETRRIWAARFDGDRLKEMPEIVKPNVRVSTFGQDNAGEVYFADYDTGRLYTLERNDAVGKNTHFPTKLSDTGLFQSPGGPPADGVVPYTPAVTQWQDGATAERLLALPGLSAVSVFEKPRPLPGQVHWHNFRMQFPKDAVLAKTISMDVIANGKTQKRPIETQILHHDGEDWRGYTYAWRDDGSDADLVPADGTEKVFEVPSALHAGGKREQVWTFHSRMQCLSCHSSWAEYALSFDTRQLTGGGAVSQLVKLSQTGYVRRVGEGDTVLPPFDAETAGREGSFSSPAHGSGSIEAQARSYLHVNCAHCHRFGGGGGQVVLEMDYAKSLKETGLFDVPPKQGDFGIPDARLVTPGQPYRSVLFYRMAKFGRGRMPHLGSEVPDPAALELMHGWITSLGKGTPEKSPATASGIDNALRSPDGALPFARGLGTRAIPGDERGKVLAAAAKLPPGPVHDLFEGYFPPDPKGRKLGPAPRPASILGLTGDAARGEALFFAEASQCAKCHKVGDRGVSLGPDLSAVAKTRTRDELLDAVLNPSARVEPQYASYLVKTADGRSFTGLLVKRDDKQVILRDPENKEVTLAAGDVEAVQPSRLSLMPEGLLAAFTAQQAADLLAFLVSRK